MLDIRLFEYSRLLEVLAQTLRCPINWESRDIPHGAKQIMAEKWYHTVFRTLPEDSEEWLLRDGTEFRFDLEVSPVTEALLDRDDLEVLIHNLLEQWPQYSETYIDSCVRHFVLRAKRSDEYPKHYSLTGSVEEIRSRSIGSLEGLLLPYITPTIQNRLVWLMLETLFENKILELRSDRSLSGSSTFDAAWSSILSEQKKFNLETLDAVGFSAGIESKCLFFDIDFSRGRFHTYPIARPKPGFPTAFCNQRLQSA